MTRNPPGWNHDFDYDEEMENMRVILEEYAEKDIEDRQREEAMSHIRRESYDYDEDVYSDDYEDD